MSREEMMYLLENAISYLYDNDLLDDFMEDRDIDMSDEAREYLIPEGEE